MKIRDTRKYFPDFLPVSASGSLGCKQDQAESFKGNLLVVYRF